MAFEGVDVHAPHSVSVTSRAAHTATTDGCSTRDSDGCRVLRHSPDVRWEVLRRVLVSRAETTTGGAASNRCFESATDPESFFLRDGTFTWTELGPVVFATRDD